jgi:HAD superfamily hydrolase (TIGR01549 family)
VKRTIKFIYFDIDDTILDHKSAERAALQDTRDALPFLQNVEIEELWSYYHKNNRRLWTEYGAGRINRAVLENNRFEWTLRDLGLDLHDAAEMREVYMQYYENHWIWIENAKDVLATLLAEYPIGFLTNGFAEVQRAKAQRFNLDTLSEFYIISEDVGFMKPSLGIFEFATRAVNCEPEEILYVGDSFVSDIEGGSTYGWKTAWFTYQPELSKAKKADIVFDDFSKLPELIANFVNK